MSDTEELTWILLLCIIGIPLISAIASAFVAARKNRSAVFWGFVGLIAPLLAPLFLALAGFLCPKCKKPLKMSGWNGNKCPSCSATW